MIASPVRRVCFAGFAATTLLLALLPVVGAQAVSPPAAPVQTGPVVSPAVHQDVSQPLRDILENQQDQQGQHEDHKPKPIRPPHSGQNSPASGTPSSTTTTAVPTTGVNFDGVGNGFSGPGGTFTVNSAPPDTNLAVGPNHVVEIVNTDFAIFNKSGTAVFGPVAINTLWSGFGGGCQTNNDGDPIAKYDSIADRWVLSQFSVTTTPYLQCVAVSRTPDPTGAYNRYSFQYTDFPDYPKMSVWPDAYYITFNMFAGGTAFTGGQACAYDRAKMLAGQAATQQCFGTGTSFGGLLASDLDGATQPPAGSPNYIVADGASANQLAYWKFHTDWTTPANTTLTGPAALATAAFTPPCGGGTCVPQSGTTQRLDTLGDRIMYRLAYRNFGDHEAMVVDRSVTAGSSVGVRWYELRTGGGNLNIFQQGTYAPDSNYRWMGSIAQDQAGDMGLGFSLSSSSLHPAIHYTGRLAGDPAGTMSQGEGTIIDGAGSQTTNLSRWGDYSAMAVDPVDGCTFWYGNEYIPSNGTFNWRTRIATFRFPNCGTPPTNDFLISATPSSASVNQGSTATYMVSTATRAGSAQSVSFSASGVPSGATASFSPASVTSGGSSTLTVSTTTSTPAGSYTITITGTGASATHSTSVGLVVNGTGQTGITNGGFETGSLAGWTSTGSTSVTTTSHSGTYAAMVGSTSPTNGDSTISQAFTAPAATGPLTFWYRIVCPDTITYDWASATLKDNTTGGSSTLLANTCSNTGTWQQSSAASLVGGHGYTLTLVNHDDNYGADPTYTLFDDVALAAAPTPNFAISASPASQSVVQGSSTSYAVTVAAQNGFAGTVSLSVSGLGAGASGSFNPATLSGGGTSTLTVSATSSAAKGTFPLTITGSSGTVSHSAGVTLVVNAPSTSVIVNGGFETGNFTGWTQSGATSISTTAHTGTHSAQVGSTSPFNGDSTIAQTFTAPSGTGHSLSFWYRVVCTDSVTYDWATATLKDNTTNTTTTVLARTCTNSGGYVQKTAALTGGHSYTLTLIDHDDNYAAPPDPTYTLYDDVSVS